MSTRQRLRAPTADGAILAVPPLSETGELLQANRRCFDSITILDRPLTDLRDSARREAIDAAIAYHQQAGEPTPSVSSTGLLLAGHQPELVHPGVWVKHFALHGLARRHGLTPLNLVVDHDTMKSAGLRLPARRAGDGRAYLMTVPFDEWHGETPYEERAIAAEATFAGFGHQVARTMGQWGFTPLVEEYWAEVRQASQRTRLIGECFAAARRAVERRWGCHNLEAPTSRLCRTRAFAWFVAHLLLNAEPFLDVHNAALAEYRRANDIQSRNHPVPELVRDGEWREVPLWGWRVGQPRRGRLFVRPTASGLELRSGGESWGTLPGRPEDLAAAWPTLETQGRKVRFRALTTTLFARLFLGDLFIHGIGGGKYDELTDVIMPRFYGITPPAYLVLSATLHLPLPTSPVERTDRARLIRQVRHVHYHPDRHLSNGRGRELAQAKQEWIETQPATAAERRQRFEAIRAINDRLRPLVADQENAARQQLAECEQRLEENAVLRRRDFAACLFPEEKLRPFLTRFLE